MQYHGHVDYLCAGTQIIASIVLSIEYSNEKHIHKLYNTLIKNQSALEGLSTTALDLAALSPRSVTSSIFANSGHCKSAVLKIKKHSWHPKSVYHCYQSMLLLKPKLAYSTKSGHKV